MQEFIQNLLLSLSQHQYIIYFLLFIISFAESFAFIGLLVPGAVFIITAGFLSSKGVLSIYDILIWSVAGAILADIGSFYLAKKFGKKIINLKSFKKYEHYYDKGKTFFEKHGGISVFWGRFFGPLRAIVPFLAGMLGMDTVKFWFYAVISGILWGICYSGAGYFFGESWQFVEASFGKLSILFLILILLIYLFIKLTKLFIFIFENTIKTFIFSLQNEDKENFLVGIIYRRYPKIYNFLITRLNPAKESGLLLTVGCLFIGFFTYLFFGVIEDIIFKDPLVRFDSNLFYTLQKFHSFIGNEIFIFFTMLGSKIPVLIFFGAGMIILFLYNKKRELIFYLINFVGGLSFLTGLKYLFHRTRPNAIYHFFNEVTPSFPSGHTFTTLILWGLSTYFIFKFLKNKKIKSILLIFTVIHVLMVGISRLYLGVHWFSDVVGAYFAGLLWLSAIITSYEYYTMKSKSDKNLKIIRDKKWKFKSVFTLILIVFFFTFNFYYVSNKTEKILSKNVKIEKNIEKLSGTLTDNIKNGKFKIYTEDIFGINKIPILMVFQVDKPSIIKMFQLAGFKYYNGLNFKKLGSMFRSFLSKQTTTIIPIFYNYYDNRPQDYNFVYFEEKNKSFPRIVVKVWDSHKTINDKRIYVALSVEEVGFRKLKKRIKLPIINYNESLPDTRKKIEQLFIKNGFSVSEIKVAKHRIFKFLNGEEGYFDGVILKIN